MDWANAEIDKSDANALATVAVNRNMTTIPRVRMFWCDSAESLPEDARGVAAMTVLCVETRAAVLRESLIRKITTAAGVDTTRSREQLIHAQWSSQDLVDTPF